MGIFNDVVALAKAGWTPSDIKEILEKDKEQKKEPEEDKKKEPEEEKEDTKVFDKKDLPKDDKEDEEDGKDYKALYESTKKTLNEIQNKNTKEDIKPEDSNIEDLIKDIKSHIS